MAATATKIPALRFPEFTGEWAREEFGNIAKRSKAKHDPAKDTVSYPCIELESLSQETGILLDIFDSRTQKSIKNKFKKGDVLFGKLRPYLKKFLVALFDGVCSSEIWVLVGSAVNNDFLYRLIQTTKFIYIANITSGSKMPRADWDYVLGSLFSYPSRAEQQKIATFLTTIDTRIQQLSRKKALLEQYKKGVMQQLFSQEIRFKDEGGKEFPAWEEKKLEEIFNFKNGLNKEKEFFGKGTPIVNFKDVFNNSDLNKSNIKGLVEVSEKEKLNYSARKGDVFFTRTSETIEEIGMAAVLTQEIEDCVFSGFVLRARPKNDLLTDLFKKYCFTVSFVRKEIIVKSSFTTRALTSGTLLNKVIIRFPASREEQQKIAVFLSTIDRQINLVSQQLERMQAFKKGLLQQLFV